MSEELRQRGYLNAAGHSHGDVVGDFEGFNLGATTLTQLKRAGIIPNKAYGGNATCKPDALVVDRRLPAPQVKLVIERKDVGEIDSEAKRSAIFTKVAEIYCLPLECSIACISDGNSTYWITVELASGIWHVITREDGYLLDTSADLPSVSGRQDISLVLRRLHDELDSCCGVLRPVTPVNPTRLAEQTWQTIWLASGDDPEDCLASFVEILLFKFLSDLGILTTDPNGTPVSFDFVASLADEQVLKYYFERVRPEIKRLFPAGSDGTSVINGIVLNPENLDHGRLFAQILKKFGGATALRRIDPEFKSRIFEKFLKKSISQKNWGQFFTPRNVVKAMVAMSGIDRLPPGAVMADPACGVGGFVLEPLVHERPHDLREAGAPSLTYKGWDRDTKTIILAKANMLIHLSEVLERDPTGAPGWLVSRS